MRQLVGQHPVAREVLGLASRPTKIITDAPPPARIVPNPTGRRPPGSASTSTRRTGSRPKKPLTAPRRVRDPALEGVVGQAPLAGRDRQLDDTATRLEPRDLERPEARVGGAVEALDRALVRVARLGGPGDAADEADGPEASITLKR